MKHRARHSHGHDKVTQDPFCFFNSMAFQQVADDLSKLLPQPVAIEKCQLMTKGWLKMRRHFERRAIRFEGLCVRDDAQGDFTFYLDPEASWYLPLTLLLRSPEKIEHELRFNRMDEIHLDALKEVCNLILASFKKSVLKIAGCCDYRDGDFACAENLLDKMDRQDSYLKVTMRLGDAKLLLLVKIEKAFQDKLDAPPLF